MDYENIYIRNKAQENDALLKQYAIKTIYY